MPLSAKARAAIKARDAAKLATSASASTAKAVGVGSSNTPSDPVGTAVRPAAAGQPSNPEPVAKKFHPRVGNPNALPRSVKVLNFLNGLLTQPEVVTAPKVSEAVADVHPAASDAVTASAALHTPKEISRIAKAAALEAKVIEMLPIQRQLIARHEKGTLQRTDEAYLSNTLKKLQNHSKARRTLHGELVGMVQVMVGKGESFKLGEKASLQKALNLNTEAEAVSKQAEGFVQAALDDVLKKRSSLFLFRDADLLGFGLKMTKSETSAGFKVPVVVELEDQTILRLVGERDRVALMIRIDARLVEPKEEAARNFANIYRENHKDKAKCDELLKAAKAEFVTLVTSLGRAEIESFSGKENAAKRKVVIKTHKKAVMKQAALTAGSVVLGAGVVATAGGAGLVLAVIVLTKSVMQGVDLVARECMKIQKLNEKLEEGLVKVRESYTSVNTVWLKEAGAQTLANVVGVPQSVTALLGPAFATVKHLGVLLETFEARVAKASEAFRKLVKDFVKLKAGSPKSLTFSKEQAKAEQALKEVRRLLAEEIKKAAKTTAGFDALVKIRKDQHEQLTAIHGVKSAANTAAVLTLVGNMAIAGAGIGLLHFDYMSGAEGPIKQALAIAEAGFITPATAVDGLANRGEFAEARHLTGQGHHGGQGGHGH